MEGYLKLVSYIELTFKYSNYENKFKKKIS